MGYGFHEDGFTHGLKAAMALADDDDQSRVQLPFEIRAPDRSVERVWVAHLFQLFEGVRRLLSFVLFSVLFFGWST